MARNRDKSLLGPKIVSEGFVPNKIFLKSLVQLLICLFRSARLWKFLGHQNQRKKERKKFSLRKSRKFPSKFWRNKFNSDFWVGHRYIHSATGWNSKDSINFILSYFFLLPSLRLGRNSWFFILWRCRPRLLKIYKFLLVRSSYAATEMP